ncbi:MAG: co-chaperone GroES [Culicoidibacterales bacterium]
MKPLFDKIVIELKEVEKTTLSGLVLPDSNNQKSNQGIVIAVGPGRMLENGQVVAPTVRVGQTVLFNKFAGSEATVNGKEYVIVAEKDIFAILD